LKAPMLWIRCPASCDAATAAEAFFRGAMEP
jgi:hypothetical protein